METNKKLQLSPQEFEGILSAVNLDGFTIPLKGKVRRYIVAFTHIEAKVLDKAFYEKLATVFSTLPAATMDSITIGGWRNMKDGSIYIDFGTSTDYYPDAEAIGIQFGQISIWDNEKGGEVVL